MKWPRAVIVVLSVAWGGLEPACKAPVNDPKVEAPPELKLQRVEDRNVFEVERPERFPLTQAVAHTSRPELKVTGTINPDVSRNVPVISLASGRVIEIRARLGDTVTNERGAIPLKDLEVAEATETKATVSIKTTLERLRVLGVDPEHPSPIVEITAPVSGVISDQQVTSASGVQGLASPNPFTISDLSYVWIVCDVFENDMANVRLGETADIRLNAYPNRVLTGTISNIAPNLDPSIRTAKVRIEVRNPGLMRPGMFVTATFHGPQIATRAAVPATAILHLQDRDWVYTPANAKQFRRVEVVGGDMLPGAMQEIISGLAPRQQVVANALEFQNSVQQQ